MVSRKTIEMLKQMACCATRDNCERCAYAGCDCVAMTSSGQDAACLAEDILKIVKLLEADAAEPAASEPAEPDPINHPAHYTYGKHECIEEMEILFGREAVVSYCRLAAYKYKYRAGHKGDAELDYAKADWYLDKARMLSAHKEQEVHDAHKQQG